MLGTFMDADALRQDLAEQKENVESWARSVLQSAKGVKNQHVNSREQHKGKHRMQVAARTCYLSGCSVWPDGSARGVRAGTITELGQQRDKLRTEAQRLRERELLTIAVDQLLHLPCCALPENLSQVMMSPLRQASRRC